MRFSKLIKTRLKELDSSNQTFSDLFQLIHADGESLFCEQIEDRIFVQKISYWEMKRLSLNLAEYIKEKHNNIRIGIKMQNSYLFIAFFWGIILSGNTPVLMNVELNNEQTENVIKDLKIEVVVDMDEAQKLNKKIAYRLPNFNFDYSNSKDEVILMTTGTSGNITFCSYSGKKVAAFIKKTPYIVEKIPQILSKKDIKQLMLLPLYHVFGFFAVYFWFAYFNRQFLFVEKIDSSLLENIRRFEVSHIFGVPAFFKLVRDGIIKEVTNQNMLKKFNDGIEKSISYQRKMPNLNRWFIRRKFKKVIENTFGFNIAFLISGGASIDEETLRIFNGIGYDLTTGYGTTEVGITSINLRTDIDGRLKSNIGTPLPNVEYKINDDSILEVLSDTQADNIVGSFLTKDICIEIDGEYEFIARDDEIITLDNGENYNLNYLQSLNYNFEVIQQYTVTSYEGNLVFLFSIKDMGQERVLKAKEEIRNNKVLKSNKITKIMFTLSPLRTGLKMINHRETNKDIENGLIEVQELSKLDEIKNDLDTEHDLTMVEIQKIIMNVLNISEPIGFNVDIFLELGSTSFDYALIMNDICDKYSLPKINQSCVLQKEVYRSITEIASAIKKIKG